MNPVIENILSRRSTRAFTDQPISREDIETILKCARYAPSGRNGRTWRFTAVLDQALIKKLASAVGNMLGKPEYNFYNPAAIIIPSNLETSFHGRDDNAAAMENIFLSANSLGISSCWVNQLSGQSRDPGIRAVLSELGIPEEHIVYGVAVLGYAAAPAKEPAKDAETVIIS